MRMPWLIRTKGEIHRFLVPSVIHFGFCHFVINTILQLAIGTVVESAMGSGRMAVFYLFVVFGSNIFGANCSSEYALGSDPIIFGFLASLFTMLLVYWHYIGGTTCTKICTFFSVAMVFIIAALLIT
jgi:membrane associated rhomboid family serine protease